MTPLIAETLSTALSILLGNCVVANVLLYRMKGMVPTAYAINPARYLGPWITHALFSVGGCSYRPYSWIPVVGPVLGGLLAAILFGLVA